MAYRSVLMVLVALLAAMIAADPARADHPRAQPFPVLPLPPEVSPPMSVHRSQPEGRARYLPLLTAEAQSRGLPAEVADAVARVESGYNSAAVGRDGERGMMQVMPATAAMVEGPLGPGAPVLCAACGHPIGSWFDYVRATSAKIRAAKTWSGKVVCDPLPPL